MTGKEISDNICEKYKRIKEIYDQGTFTLNNEIELLFKEIMSLQKKCPHDFEKNVCIYCGIVKEIEK